LKHLEDAAMQWSDAQYLRRQYQRQGSAEGMVDSAIRGFRGEAMKF
jgi:carboxylate-amine ligase